MFRNTLAGSKTMHTGRQGTNTNDKRVLLRQGKDGRGVAGGGVAPGTVTVALPVE